MSHHILKTALLGISILVGILLVVLLLTAILRLGLLRAEVAITEHYLKKEEAVIIASRNDTGAALVLPVKEALFEYVEVLDGCGPYFQGECLNARLGPGEDFPVAGKLRNGMVLKVGGVVERDGRQWYKIVFDEWLRYPERVKGDFYVVADYVRVLLDEGVRNLDKQTKPSTKRVIVDRSDQKLYAYDGEELFMEVSISTGLELTPTPRGTFTVFKKTPSRYMQGPIQGISEKEYDLPGVPWNLYFTNQGAVIHGTYWHD
ncbi:MAG: L,D-transpeptidase family protein, partial [Patescibacteria group bacterium]